MIETLLAFFSGDMGGADRSKAGEKQSDVTRIELRITSDGKAIVDQNGKEIAQFVEGMPVKTIPKESE